MKMKILSLLGVAAFTLGFAFPSSAAVIGNLNIVPTTVNQRQAIAVTGTCSATAANIMVDVTVANGTSVLRSTPTASASGSFVTVINIPDVYPSGTANVVALCANGDSLTGSVQITQSTNAVLVVSNTGTLGQPLLISGSCGNNTSGNVTLTINQGGSSVVLGNATTVGANGNFQVTVNLPTSLSTGAAVITATCPDGRVVSTAINLSSPATTPPPSNNNGNNQGGNGDDGGDVGGVTDDEDTTPQGGVAAGSKGDLVLWASLLMVLAGVSGVYASRKLQISQE